MTRRTDVVWQPATAGHVAAGHNLHGRNVIVTGGTHGLDAETARVLAGAGAAVVACAWTVTGAMRSVAADAKPSSTAAVSVGRRLISFIVGISSFTVNPDLSP